MVGDAWLFIPNLSSSIEVLLADERYYFLCNLSKDYSSGNICQSDMPQEFIYFPLNISGDLPLSCLILCLLCLHLLLLFTATLLFIILSSSHLSVYVSNIY